MLYFQLVFIGVIKIWKCAIIIIHFVHLESDNFVEIVFDF